MSAEGGRPLDGSALPAADVARIIEAVAAVLDSRHDAGEVRGTLTPAAIVARRDEKGRVTDVGLTDPATHERAWLYAAPEVSSSGWRTAESDQYSLGAVAWQLLTGRPPFAAADETGQRIAHASSPAPRISSVRPELAGADAVLVRALSKSRSGRFGTCSEFAAALRSGLESVDPDGDVPGVEVSGADGAAAAIRTAAGGEAIATPGPAPAGPGIRKVSLKKSSLGRDYLDNPSETRRSETKSPIPATDAETAPSRMQAPRTPAPRKPIRSESDRRAAGRRTAVITVCVMVLVCVTAVLLDRVVGGESSKTSTRPAGIAGWGTEALNSAMTSAARSLGPGDSGLRYIGAGTVLGDIAFGTGAAQFLGTDAPLTGPELDKASKYCGADEVRHIPLAVTALAIVYNLPGVDRLVLDIPTMAGIFGGRITMWNDPEIVALNPSATLPDSRISRVQRTGETAELLALQRFLRVRASPTWEVAPSSFVPTTGKIYNPGDVRDAVDATPGTISFLHLGSLSLRRNLPMAEIDFGSGPVPLTAATTEPALNSVRIVGSKNTVGAIVDDFTLLNGRAPGSYPLLTPLYAVLCSATRRDAKPRTELRWALSRVIDDQLGASPTETGYVRLPSHLRSAAMRSVYQAK